MLCRQEGDNASRQKPNSEDCVDRQERDNASRQKPYCEDALAKGKGKKGKGAGKKFDNS